MWTMRDGGQIAVAAMSDAHLNAAIIMVRRRYRRLRVLLAFKAALPMLAYATTAPDGAAMAVGQEIEAMMTEEGLDALLADKLPDLVPIFAEAERRQIKVAMR